jgi:hypothetical protein
MQPFCFLFWTKGRVYLSKSRCRHLPTTRRNKKKPGTSRPRLLLNYFYTNTLTTIIQFIILSVAKIDNFFDMQHFRLPFPIKSGIYLSTIRDRRYQSRCRHLPTARRNKKKPRTSRPRLFTESFYTNSLPTII